MNRAEPQEIVIKGIGVAPGICIGKAYLVGREGVNVIKKYYISDSEIENEKTRFKEAVSKVKEELKAIIDETPEDFRDHASIIETHILLLKDKMLYGKTIESIENKRVNAEWALKNVVSELKAMFLKMPDPYLRERASDIGHVSDRIMSNLVGKDPVNIKSIDKRVILVATDLSPAQASQIQLEWIKGFVTDGGGIASHTGIIARTLEIPAVLGLNNATHIIKNDDLIVVDGTTGTLIVHPTENTLVKYEEKTIRYEQRRALISRVSQLPAKTTDGVLIKIMGNIELPEEVVSVRDYGGCGIGLYRTEFQYMGRPDFPSEEELFDKYKDVVEIIAPNYVTIRTLDINGDKNISQYSGDHEDNPVLGLRAIRYCLQKPDIFLVQLRAILRAAAYGKVRIMIPMISGIHEIIETKKMLDAAAKSLKKDGLKFTRDIELGAMIEVPSAVVMADSLAEEVDFFSIGTNDLIQYTLAIDRGNQHVSYLYQPLHPAILRMIKRVVDEGHKKGIDVFMCGEMAGDPMHLPILLGMEIDELSMNPQSIPMVKNAIRMISFKETKAFVKEVMAKTSEKEIRVLLEQKYAHLITENIYNE